MSLFLSSLNIKESSLSIAMLGHKRIPSREGGIEVVVMELATRMVERGHKLCCYNRRGHHVAGLQFDELQVSDEYKGVKLKSVFTIDRKGLAAMSSSFFSALHTSFGKYDIVHFHAEGPCVMLWLPKLLGKRCIVTIHGLDWQRDKWKEGFGSKYIKFGEKVAVKLADEIIVLSKGVHNYFLNTYGRETTYIPNGVNRPLWKAAKEIKEKFELSKDSYICYLGRLTEEKGLRYLIEAYKYVKTDKKLIIAGGASDSDNFVKELKQMATGDERIIFTGFVQGDLLEELYSNAYVYTIPSNLEGMPLSLLEAMSYGNCCLVSNITECTEVVEDKAVVFCKGDVNDLTKKLQMLCDNPELVAKFKIEAADFICNKYSWDDIVNQTLQLYEGIKKIGL